MRLLVSVLSAEEAREALAGGADIIDVKDPRHGPLGAPAPHVLSEVVRTVGGAEPVSAALGDVPADPRIAAEAARGAERRGAGYIKVGLREVPDTDTAVAILGAVQAAVRPRTAIVAVAYADAAALDPPAFPPACLPVLVERTGIAGALVDTFAKDGRGLYGWLAERELGDLIARTHRVGGSFAVAGQLALGQLRRVPADVVGVRSTVCRGGDRMAALDAGRVRAAVAELRSDNAGQPGTMRVPTPPGARTTTLTPVPRTTSGR